LRLTRLEAKKKLANLRGWHLRGKEISRVFVFDDFAESMRFVNRVARRAESVNHHPDILIRYNKVRLSITTHDEGGLTVKDFRLARQVNQITRG
jgi:4a-hydroxytetrahydrobiopterin dehydratase